MTSCSIVEARVRFGTSHYRGFWGRIRVWLLLVQVIQGFGVVGSLYRTLQQQVSFRRGPGTKLRGAVVLTFGCCRSDSFRLWPAFCDGPRFSWVSGTKLYHESSYIFAPYPDRGATRVNVVGYLGGEVTVGTSF